MKCECFVFSVVFNSRCDVLYNLQVAFISVSKWQTINDNVEEWSAHFPWTSPSARLCLFIVALRQHRQIDFRPNLNCFYHNRIFWKFSGTDTDIFILVDTKSRHCLPLFFCLFLSDSHFVIILTASRERPLSKLLLPRYSSNFIAASLFLSLRTRIHYTKEVFGGQYAGYLQTQTAASRICSTLFWDFTGIEELLPQRIFTKKNDKCECKNKQSVEWGPTRNSSTVTTVYAVCKLWYV